MSSKRSKPVNLDRPFDGIVGDIIYFYRGILNNYDAPVSIAKDLIITDGDPQLHSENDKLYLKDLAFDEMILCFEWQANTSRLIQKKCSNDNSNNSANNDYSDNSSNSNSSSSSNSSVTQTHVAFNWSKGSCFSREYKVSVSCGDYSTSITNQ